MLTKASSRKRNFSWNAGFSTYAVARVTNIPKPVTLAATTVPHVQGVSSRTIRLTG